MANFVEAFGDTLLMGSELAGRAQALKRQQALDQQAREAQLLQNALLQRNMERQRGEDILSAGPGSRITPQQAQEVEKAGFGNRLAPFMQDVREIDPNVVIPIQVKGEGQQILPSFEQQRQISADTRATEMHGLQVGDLKAQAAERDKQANLRSLVSTPEFWNQPTEKRQVIWSQAGYSGQAPLSWDEMTDRLDYEHKLEMEKVNRTIQGQKEVAGIRGSSMTQGQHFNATMRMRTSFNKETEFARKIKQQYGLMEQGMQAVMKGDGAAGGQAVLTTFQKILDPESVVRESEYARSQYGQPLVAALRGAYERATMGGTGVDRVELAKYVQLAKQFVDEQDAFLAAKQQEYADFADHYQIPRELVLGRGLQRTPEGSAVIPTNEPATSGSNQVRYDSQGRPIPNSPR